MCWSRLMKRPPPAAPSETSSLSQLWKFNQVAWCDLCRCFLSQKNYLSDFDASRMETTLCTLHSIKNKFWTSDDMELVINASLFFGLAKKTSETSMPSES